jgi:Arf-GAP/coiled-coil/ANK repeat/PH domain-containing protein
VQVSKVRSITLDTWEPEQLKVMLELGNHAVNRCYEAEVDETVAARATPECNRVVREAWIRAKYVQKAFIKKLPGINKTNSLKKWSVRKKIKRSTGRKMKRDQSQESDSKSTDSTSIKKGDSASLSDSEDLTSGLMEGGDSGTSRAVLSVSKPIAKDNSSISSGIESIVDVGPGGADGIVFGSESPVVDLKRLNKNFDIESSDDSCQDYDDEASAAGGNVTVDGDDLTTSWEDMSKLDPNLLLYKASGARNLPVMLEALSNKADPNWVNLEDEGKTPIMKAIQTGSLVVCEFLLLNNGKLDRKDKHGRTPLHHATILGHTGQVCQFLKRRADQNAKDNKGMTPLMIAVENANADIVTLLRLSKLNDEMKESDGYLGNPGDETFQDVFRDFTNMASNNPEKLKRK